MPEDTIEVPSSEVEEETTDTTPSEETPDETPEETPEEPEEELFELPDGRKVDGETLAREWKENFLPDYTRKSQELADKNRSTLPNETTPENPYADPNYVPQTYAEIIEAAKQAALSEIAQEREAEAAAHKAAEDAVVEQLESVKKIDPSIDENKLFLHANKYGFRDLTAAYQNMKDMGQVAKTVQKQTAENIQKRKDPVSVQPGGTVDTTPDPSAFESAVEYMRSLKT